jgi:hypothetical protein
MIEIRRLAGRREGGPANPANASHRPHTAAAYVMLLVARGLVSLATSIFRLAERGYRAGCLDLAQVEMSVRISAKLRGRARRLIGTEAGSASGRAASKLARPV